MCYTVQDIYGQTSIFISEFRNQIFVTHPAYDPTY